MDSTKNTFGSTKRKATDTSNDAKDMAQEKMDQASKSTKQAAERTGQKLHQAASGAESKGDRVRLLSHHPLPPRPDICIPGISQFPPRGTRSREEKHDDTDPKHRVCDAFIVPLIKLS